MCFFILAGTALHSVVTALIIMVIILIILAIITLAVTLKAQLLSAQLAPSLSPTALLSQSAYILPGLVYEWPTNPVAV